MTLHRVKFAFRLACAASAAAVLAGCVNVPAYEQVLVSKPNMVFEDSGTFAVGSALHVQNEPAAEGGGTAPSGGCTACR